MLLHALLLIWLLPAVFLLGNAWPYNTTMRDRAITVGLVFTWPVSAPLVWLINRFVAR